MNRLARKFKYARWAAHADLETRRLYGAGRVVPGDVLRDFYDRRYGSSSGWDCRDVIVPYAQSQGWDRRL